MIYDHLPLRGGIWCCGCETEAHTTVGEADRCRRDKVLDTPAVQPMRRAATVEQVQAWIEETVYDFRMLSFQDWLAAQPDRYVALAGWQCATCGVFNGEEKTRRETCRACDTTRPA